MKKKSLTMISSYGVLHTRIVRGYHLSADRVISQGTALTRVKDRANLEGSGPGDIRQVWDQDAKNSSMLSSKLENVHQTTKTIGNLTLKTKNRANSRVCRVLSACRMCKMHLIHSTTACI